MKPLSCLGGALLAPIAVPIAFTYYIGYRATKYAFKNPKSTVAAFGTVACMSYIAHNTGARTALYEKVSSGIEEVKGLIHGRAQSKQQNEQLQYLAKQYLDLEKRLQESEAKKALLNKQLDEYQKTDQKEVPKEQVPEQHLKSENYNFYYTDVNDTLESIARRVSGRNDTYRMIAADNGIIDTRTLMAGQILKIRKELCTGDVRRVYSEVSILPSVILPGNVRISEQFPQSSQAVLSLNHELGLSYEDSFPYPQGARIVYYTR